ncbi:DUF1835 domain-containing protein [Flavobacterium sp. LC2016-12]|uniref:DUF1835 domain-containing protein n=1 Tax=Flavobacterium sp. LC2016-12 TaxID=2783794 RepID=UPI00188A390C|nr:DUF1835 domain-containing protein [Flavobacterium sp. LC2016-12]MBF4465424.1 DUF1835 domain-containing protein [Flavobacterium sp. LC2016-12]
MIYNILNGDSLAYSFPETKIEGDIIVVREALIDGDLSGNDLQNFWHSRAKYLEVTEAEYHDKVVNEFEKIMNVRGDSEFNLWFEYDLFCQVNMWFIISVINSLPVKRKVYAVHTSYLDRNNKYFWNGFGPANLSQLQACFADRVLLSYADLQLGQELWTAYKDNNFEQLIYLAKNQSFAFPYLQEVVKAHIERFPKVGSKGRPEKVIEDIIKNVSTDFHKVFKEFCNRESIYGFGDTQVKVIYDKVMLYQDTNDNCF